ncbi:class Ib ribonucleoside-diphosphate reductase assembly flavoprotein NrdI [Dietzia sp.]|uniref:class Ib ribonucleoside-diphosphate reductase assembly flavoprotein NrdI n=1 Tax=Dietzia sp. TaxID=1871616 RepID=UPI002FDB8FAB
MATPAAPAGPREQGEASLADGQGDAAGRVHVVFFSNISENTARFVGKLGFDSTRIPIRAADEMPEMSEPFVLIVPTYGGCLSVTGREGSHVPRQVKKFLAIEGNRALARGVVAGGNSNFGTSFGAAGEAIAAKLGVPYLYRFELMGTHEDVENVREGLEEFWQHQR